MTPFNRPTAETLQLAREIERVLREIQADLDAAEAKFARNRDPAARREPAASATIGSA